MDCSSLYLETILTKIEEGEITSPDSICIEPENCFRDSIKKEFWALSDEDRERAIEESVRILEDFRKKGN